MRMPSGHLKQGKRQTEGALSPVASGQPEGALKEQYAEEEQNS